MRFWKWRRESRSMGNEAASGNYRRLPKDDIEKGYYCFCTGSWASSVDESSGIIQVQPHFCPLRDVFPFLPFSGSLYFCLAHPHHSTFSFFCTGNLVGGCCRGHVSTDAYSSPSTRPQRLLGI